MSGGMLTRLAKNLPFYQSRITVFTSCAVLNIPISNISNFMQYRLRCQIRILFIMDVVNIKILSSNEFLRLFFIFFMDIINISMEAY